jgi:hypothetical protein
MALSGFNGLALGGNFLCFVGVGWNFTWKKCIFPELEGDFELAGVGLAELAVKLARVRTGGGVAAGGTIWGKVRGRSGFVGGSFRGD